MFHTFFNHSSIEGHLGCFQVLAITNSAAMNIVEQMLLWCEVTQTQKEEYGMYSLISGF